MESKWVGEIAENTQGVKLVLVALKCDLREQAKANGEETADDSQQQQEKVDYISYNEGLAVARRIHVSRSRVI